MIHLLAPSGLVRVWLESLVGTHYGGEVLEQPLSDVERGLYEFLLLKFIQTAHRKLLPGQAEGLYLAAVESPPAGPPARRRDGCGPFPVPVPGPAGGPPRGDPGSGARKLDHAVGSGRNGRLARG